MLTKIRENIYLADEKVTVDDLKKVGVTVVQFVGPAKIKWMNEVNAHEFVLFSTLLNRPDSGKVNRPHVKDIACHIPKYMTQNGETIAIIGVTGFVRGAFVIARAICELENKSIYDVFLELQDLLPKAPADPHFDVGKAYL